MLEIENALREYVYDPENPEKNYNLAVLYFKQQQYAGAISFYLRCAERTDNKILAYTCILKIAQAFAAQEGRPNTVRGLYKHAIYFMPNRPEGYYLLANHYQQIKEYADGYMIAELGLQNGTDSTPLLDEVGYPGKYALIFEKAVCAWWWGKAMESRKLFHLLADDYADVMDESHYNAVQNNMTNLGSGPESQAFRYYDKSQYPKLRFKFPGSETILRTYSQVYQDMFILSMLNGKRNGKYLEIGSAKPWLGNNTALLEMQFDWTGIGLEYKPEFVNEYNSQRKNKSVLADATKVNYKKILKELAPDGVVDYLQLDCEPSKTTFDILLMIPFDQFKFAVISYEHDHYVDITRSYRFKSRKYLESMGYELVVSDVSPDGISTFEDWWVHPDLVSREIIEKMKDVDGIKRIEKYFLNAI